MLKTKWSIVLTLTLCALLLSMPGIAKDQGGNGGNPGVLPPQSNAFSASYGEWVARWWQWMGAFPAEISPGFDETGEDAARGQSGHVWFLADCPPFMLGPQDTITRTVDIPAGKALFFPVCMLPWLTIPGLDFPIEDPPIDPIEWFLENEDWIRPIYETYMNGVSELVCTIDGKMVQDIEQYYIESPVFGMYADEAIGWPSDYYAACIADGVWLMLSPLSVGNHTIHFRVVQHLWDWGPEGHTRYVDVTYNLTVVPAKKK